MEVETQGSAKLQKLQKQRQKRRERKKAKKKQQQEHQQKVAEVPQEDGDVKVEEEEEFEIEYVAAPVFQNEEEASMFEDIKEIVDHFSMNQQEEEQVPEKSETVEEVKEEKLSKKKRKLQKRLPIAVLKQLVERPDLVEIHDTSAADPFILLHLKSMRNTVPIPRHWSQKKKYLQGKRGIEKQPFELPDFIKATNIDAIRDSNREAHKKLKTKARERLRPTLGKMDIDYQILHDAFFKYQTKPQMTIFGDIYYEGKEYEVELLEKRPGLLSERLKEALGMQTGSPPPWLHHMQRVGMPPSYQTLRIPGMNAPRPPGTEYGYHPGGWGQPPLDEYGNALFPEAFSEPVEYDRMEFPLLEGNHWGVLAKEEYESSEEEKESSEEEEEEEEAMAALAGVEISAAPVQEEDTDLSGIETPLSGMETPSNIEATLRKTKKNKELYTVLEQRETSVSSGELYGSSHLYVVPSKKDKKQSSSTATVDLMKSQRTEEIELSLDPSEIPDLTEDALAKKFDREMADRKKKESQGQGEGDKKRKRTTSSSSQPKKKKKKDDFKF